MNPYDKANNLTLFSEKSDVSILTHVELSRSMATIVEMPQYVAFQQKNVVYTFIKLSAKSHSFNILHTIDGLNCPTTMHSTLFFLNLACRIRQEGPYPTGLI